MACKHFYLIFSCHLLTEYHSTVRPVADSDERVIVILGGSPRDPDWEGLCDSAATAMEETRAELEDAGVLLPKHYSHRWGEFCAFAVGNSHGGGRKVCHVALPPFIQLIHLQRPGRIVNSPVIGQVLSKLVKLPSFCRLAGFANSEC
jgi:hypothetical protein